MEREEILDVVISFPGDHQREQELSSPASTSFEPRASPYNEEVPLSPANDANDHSAIHDERTPSPKGEYMFPRPLTEIDYYIERRRAYYSGELDPLSITESSIDNERKAVIKDILDHYVEPASVVSVSDTLDELRASYTDVCQAVVEFEQKISTLRANSKSESLTLAQALVTRNATEIFKTLRDFEPRPRPKLSDELNRRLQEAISARSSQSPSNVPKKSEKAEQEEQPPDSEKEDENSSGDRATEHKYSLLARLFYRGFASAESQKPSEHPDPVKVSGPQGRELAREWEREQLRLFDLMQTWSLRRERKNGVLSNLMLCVGKKLPSGFGLRGLIFNVFGLDPSYEKKMKNELQAFEQRVGGNFDWKKHRRWARRLTEKKKKDWELEWSWELDWDIEWQHKEDAEQEKGRAERWEDASDWPAKVMRRRDSDQPGEHSRNDWWITMARIREEIELLVDDERPFSNEQEEIECLMQQVWWKDAETWVGRWGKRRRAVNSFSKTCLALVNESGNIDGSALAQEINVFKFRGSYMSLQSGPFEHRQLVERYIAEIREAMLCGDKGRFMGSCSSIFKIISGRLRSETVGRGLELLIKKQDHYRNSFMDFATLATFFSSITATTLQFSFATANATIISTVVNVCWFASLVLSIASATNSFLGAVVHQSTEFLRPSQKFDRQLLQKWFKYIPSFLLAFSGALFLAGLCTFTFSSSTQNPNQGKVTQYVTLSLTSSNFLAILLIVLLAFTRVIHVGSKVMLVFLAIILALALFGVILGVELPLLAIILGLVAAILAPALAFVIPLFALCLPILPIMLVAKFIIIKRSAVREEATESPDKDEQTQTVGDEVLVAS